MSLSPSRKENAKRNQNWSDDESRPSCPVCSTEAPTKNGSYQRNPHGFLRRLRDLERINGVLWQQQRIRTIKEGLISREASTELAQEMFPGISSDAVEQLFIESKQRYLRGRDLEVN